MSRIRGGKSRHNRFHLDLDNFDGDHIPEECPFVLTSPRSLEACRILDVKVGQDLQMYSGAFFSQSSAFIR